MTDQEVQIIFRKIRESERPVPVHLDKLFRRLRTFYRKSGGLSTRQIELLQSIERQLTE